MIKGAFIYTLFLFQAFSSLCKLILLSTKKYLGQNFIKIEINKTLTSEIDRSKLNLSADLQEVNHNFYFKKRN